MRPSFTVPPVPQTFCICLASFSFSGSPIPMKLATTVTVLPLRCEVCRKMSTRPRFLHGAADAERGGWPGAGAAAGASGPAGSPSLLNPENGLWPKSSPPSVGILFFGGMCALLFVRSALACGFDFVHVPKANHLVIPGIAQMEAGLLDFLRHLRHVRHTPGDNDGLRFTEPGANFLQDPPIAFPENVLNQGLLKMRRRRILQNLHDRL